MWVAVYREQVDAIIRTDDTSSRWLLIEDALDAPPAVVEEPGLVVVAPGAPLVELADDPEDASVPVIST